jgi:hypothetical protein
MASLSEIEADVKARVEAAKQHLEAFVNDHIGPLHTVLTDLGNAATSVEGSPVVNEVTRLLPPEVGEALRLVEDFLITGSKAIASVQVPAPQAEASAEQAAPVVAPPAPAAPSAG